MTEALERLKDLVPTLSSISELKGDIATIIVDEGEGQVLGTGLLKQDSIAVSKWRVDSNTPIPKHVHTATEWVIVYKGECKIKVGKTIHELKTGDSLKIEPNTPHRVLCTKGFCKLIAITIPADTGYPDTGGVVGKK